MKYFILILCIIFPTLTYSAGPITHVYLAEQWLIYSTPQTPQQHSSFIVGTLFPDIRYLGVLSRKQTHPVGLTFDDIIKSPTPFVAGARFHALIDEKREDYVVKNNIYQYIKSLGQGHDATLLKLVEDEILFDRINRAHVLQDLKEITEDEKAWNVPLKDLEEWHFILEQYFTMRPSYMLFYLAETGRPMFDVPNDVVKHWSIHFHALVQQKELQDYVFNMVHYFNAMFKRESSQ